jgi:hypothetical protein
MRIVNMRCARLGMIATGVILVASTILAQEVGYLDLTDPVPREPIHSPTGGGVGGYCGSSGSSALPEVTLTLVNVDKSTYSMGEEVTFEVRVVNTGKKNIEIPGLLI